jgi:peptide/nickel transport system permease protein
VVTVNLYLALRKILQGVILVIFVAIIIFVVYRLMPGNPLDLFIHNLGPKATPADAKRLAIRLGLENGKWSLSGFLIYMKDMFTGNFGTDYYSGETVLQLIKTALPYTLVLVGTATVLGWVIGIPLGITVSRLRNRKSESITLSASVILTSIPYFALAIFLYLFLVANPSTSIFPVSSEFYFNLSKNSVLTIIRDLALPVVTLTVVGATGHLITMRASMVSTLGEDYITTARAKGVPEKAILRRHAARNAIIPVSTRMALEIALIVSGALIVEIIFSIPGMGLLLYDATFQEDYPLAEAAVFIISLMTVVAYILIDYIHSWLDPRIRV